MSETRLPYGYVGGDPVDRLDPTGLGAESLEGGCPSPICFPFPTAGQVEGAAEAIEGLPGELLGEAGGLLGSIGSIFEGEESSSSPVNAESEPCDEPRNTGDQDALIQLGKHANKTGLSESDAEILREWAEEYEVPFRGPEAHPGRGFGSLPHYRLGPLRHIPAK